MARSGYRPPWPFLAHGQLPHAFIYMAHNNEATTMYDPAVFTLGEGLSRAGASVALVTNKETERMLHNISLAKAMDPGKNVTVVAIAYAYSTNSALSVLAKAKHAGAYIVLYQSEPDRCVSRSQVTGYHADEVWDYSYANLQRCYPGYPNNYRVKARYMPPGYTRAWDTDVDLHGAGRNTRAVGFLGAICCGRKEQWYRYISNFRAHGSLENTFNIWSPEQLKQWVEHHPIQLNFHKSAGREDEEPVEAFRMSTLLSNKGCVISAISHPKDMEQFRDIVHFTASGDEGKLLEELSDRSIECQEKAYRIFKERFDPLSLLRESGFISDRLPQTADR